MAGLGATHWDCLILDLTFASLKLLDGNKKKDRGTGNLREGSASLNFPFASIRLLRERKQQ